MKKLTRNLDNANTLEQRYNKAMVCAQLKAIFSYETDDQLYKDHDKVIEAWEATSTNRGDRPRFFNIKDVFKLEQDMLVLTSSYSTYWDKYEYVVFTINFRNYANFGLPVVRSLVDSLGGPNVISRVIVDGGLNGLIKFLEDSITAASDYETKDKINSNVKVLNQFKGAISVRDN
jgi:hypothetical protein